MLIGIVGPCSAGKTTLSRLLSATGLTARAIGQEHSYVPYMWQRMTNPDVLIFLDVSYDEAQRRRWLNWTPADYAEQHRRLAHARTHCHLYLPTDGLKPEEVCAQVVTFVQTLPRPAEK